MTFLRKEGLKWLIATSEMEEVRIPGPIKRILQAGFLPSGNLQEKSQPDLANGVEARRRPR